MVDIWKDLKPVMERLKTVIHEETSTNASIFSCFRASVGVIVNILILICCLAFNIEVYMYILAVCIGNMIMYVLNYISLKVSEYHSP